MFKIPNFLSLLFFGNRWHPQGYQKVRVSVIAGSQDDAADFPFSYREAFKYRWTRNYLLSSLVECPGDFQTSLFFPNPKKLDFEIFPDSSRIEWSILNFSSISVQRSEQLQPSHRTLAVITFFTVTPRADSTWQKIMPRSAAWWTYMIVNERHDCASEKKETLSVEIKRETNRIDEDHYWIPLNNVGTPRRNGKVLRC